MSTQRRRTLDATAKSAAGSANNRRKLTGAAAIRAEAQAAAQQDRDASDETVKVVVPKAFTLVIDHHHDVKYPAGTYDMPVDHAENWWSKANGVVLAN